MRSYFQTYECSKLLFLSHRTSSIGGTRATKVQTRQLCQDKIGQNKFKDTGKL